MNGGRLLKIHSVPCFHLIFCGCCLFNMSATIFLMLCYPNFYTPLVGTNVYLSTTTRNTLLLEKWPLTLIAFHCQACRSKCAIAH